MAKIHKNASLEERLANKSAQRGDCIVWTGYVNRLGYGKLTVHNKLLWAHRVAWEAAHGPIPSGLLVCHRCDNPPCINPAHLFLGTTGDNLRDSVAKGRRAGLGGQKGETHYGAKLTVAAVLAIRASNKTNTELAAEYPVAFQTISAIRNRKTWKHVKEI